MFGKPKIENNNVWRRNTLKFGKNTLLRVVFSTLFSVFRLVMKHCVPYLVYYLKSDNREFQSLEKRKSKFQCLEKPKKTNPLFGKLKVEKGEFQCLEKRQLRIPMFGKSKIKNSTI